MTERKDQAGLRSAIVGFESSAFNFGARFIPDSMMRADYNLKARNLSTEIINQVKTGKLSASEGARRASEMRNLLMDATRGKTSEIARAYAFREKAIGKSLIELEHRYADRLFSKPFTSLGAGQKGLVWNEVVFAAGRPRIKANQLATLFGVAGRSFIAITITISVYNIVTADDAAKATAQESAVLGGGLLGSVAGGAAAGLACGPGAPVCVSIGVFVGGVMFAVGAQLTFDSFWK